jgi:endoplasmic reticulum Man9GlcNAc2 1,2-alpha-mannosidase
MSPIRPNIDPPHELPDFPGATEQDFNIHPGDVHNLLRPETIESLFYMYRLTGDKVYREYAYNMFQAFEKYTRVEHGYTSLRDVRNTVVGDKNNYKDKMETFFLGETMKYFYLIFTDDIPLDKYVFNTEAHPFPIFTPSAELSKKLLFLDD